MAVKGIIRTVGLAALAAGIATAALPAAAIAAPDDEGRGWNRGTEERAARHERQPDNGGNGGGWGARNSAPAAAQSPQQVPAQPARGWNGNATSSTSAGSWNGGDRGTGWRGRNQQQTPPAQVRTQPAPVQSAPAQSTTSWRGGDNDRNRDATVRRSEPQRNDQWRGRDNDRGNWSGRDNWRGNDNARRNDDWRRNDNWRQADHRDWNRDWRRDNRYDWRSYRDRNRSHYRMGRYYSPYNGWSYRRLSIGFTLGSMFYSDRYWIDDPWSYRLPEVYGPYRWVRYYDDALLVNVYTGEVVDVIYDIFW